MIKDQKNENYENLFARLDYFYTFLPDAGNSLYHIASHSM